MISSHVLWCLQPSNSSSFIPFSSLHSPGFLSLLVLQYLIWILRFFYISVKKIFDISWDSLISSVEILHSNKDRDRDIIHLLTDSSNGFNSWGWARMKPGAQNCNQHSQAGSRDPSTWATIHWFLREAGDASSGLTCRTATIVPIFLYCDEDRIIFTNCPE